MSRPVIVFIGPMVGSNPGFVVTQGEILARLLEHKGYDIHIASKNKNRYIRILDVIRILIIRAFSYQIQCLQVFGGLSFVVEDIASFLAKQLHKRIIMVARGGALPEFFKKYPQWGRRVFKRADVIVCPSRYLADFFESRGYPVTVIPNGIDVHRYPYRCRTVVRPKIFWMRAYHEIYNPWLAIRVAEKLIPKFPDFHLTMAGQKKGLEIKLQKYVDKKRLNDHITILGYADFATKVRLFQDNDIYINTNRIDNVPVSVLEALACGLPVVATRVGGIPYLLEHNQTALFVHDNDRDEMARAICRLIEEPGLAEHLSINGRKYVEQFDWENILNRWESLFASLMAAKDGTFNIKHKIDSNTQQK